MITTTEIQPALELVPFIRCYSLRRFNTQGHNLVKSWNALHEISMVFFFKDVPVNLVDPQTHQIINNGHNSGVMGAATQYNGEMTFNGAYEFFEIIFKPNGFYKIFGIPHSKILNHIIDGEQILSNRIPVLYEQLCHCKELNEMAVVANNFLLPFLKKQNSFYTNDGITSIYNLILKNDGLVNIDKIAKEANMSIRTFERHFIEQVGMPPKLFSNIVRFNHALNLKFQDPKKSWTSIGYMAGYFDQMHFIKDFKRFAGNTPTSFFKLTPLKEETFTNRVKF